MRSSITLGLALATLGQVALGFQQVHGAEKAWRVARLDTLVTFGDSFTDEGRLGYFIGHDGEAPPVGWVGPRNNETASGGLAWARLAAESFQATLYNYAVSGAVCSNNITPRRFDLIGADFPAVEQYEVPAFIADTRLRNTQIRAPASKTVYAMWIGTNDLGNDAFLTDSQAKGKVIPDYVDCVFNAFDDLYQNGGRYFILMNVAPLQLLPQYATPENGGLPATQFWPNKYENITLASYRMWQSVATANEIFAYRTLFEILLQRRYRDAHFAIMDTNSLLTDAYNTPTKFFSKPMNVTGYALHCNLDGDDCSTAGDPATFMWYDPLHPSEATSRLVADHFVDVIQGKSKYGSYF